MMAFTKLSNTGQRKGKPEQPVKVEERDEKLEHEINTPVPRKHPPKCQSCLDNEKKKYKDCGCHKCGGKNDPECPHARSHHNKHAEEGLETGNFCNCSICRNRSGKGATGILIHLAHVPWL